MIAISLGPDRAVLGTSEGINRLPTVRIEECNAIGAGDNFLAGSVIGLVRDTTQREALALVIAAGTAPVTTCGAAQVLRADVENHYRKICGEPEPISMSGT